MNDRQSNILRLVVDEYVENAQPVSSQLLCAKYDLDCSPATVRNDMMMLEEEGYVHQPHTSAGRVPTEEGYRYYLANFLAPKMPRATSELREAMEQMRSLESKVQMMGRRLAELSGALGVDAVKQAQSKSMGTVTEAGLESGADDDAQVLVAVAVKTSNAVAAEQQPRVSRMRIAVQKVGDQAKVSNVEFVP